MIELPGEFMVASCLMLLFVFLNEIKISVFKNRSDENLEKSGVLALISSFFAFGIIITGFRSGMNFSLLWPFMLYALAMLAFGIFRIKKLEIVIM